jgi:hypothetical protein
MISLVVPLRTLVTSMVTISLISLLVLVATLLVRRATASDTGTLTSPISFMNRWSQSWCSLDIIA